MFSAGVRLGLTGSRNFCANAHRRNKHANEHSVIVSTPSTFHRSPETYRLVDTVDTGKGASHAMHEGTYLDLVSMDRRPENKPRDSLIVVVVMVVVVIVVAVLLFERKREEEKGACLRLYSGARGRSEVSNGQ